MTRNKNGYQGQKLPAHIVEGIKQMYAMEGNKSAVARAFGVNLTTVYRILGREDPEIARERRCEALGKLASTLSENAQRLAEDISIPPEDATYMQKATAMGISTDKVVNLSKHLHEQHKDDKIEAGELMVLPGSVDEIHGMLRNDLRFLVGVLGASVLKDLTPKDQVLQEDLKVVEAEVMKLSDLDIGAPDGEQRTAGSDSSASG